MTQKQQRLWHKAAKITATMTQTAEIAKKITTTRAQKPK